MKIKYKETIVNIINENNEIEETITTKDPFFIPEANEAIRNKVTGDIYAGVTYPGTGHKLEDYEAIAISEQQNN